MYQKQQVIPFLRCSFLSELMIEDFPTFGTPITMMLLSTFWNQSETVESNLDNTLGASKKEKKDFGRFLEGAIYGNILFNIQDPINFRPRMVETWACANP